MSETSAKRDVAVAMRFREEDLGVIDRGAELRGVSRTEFVRRAALHDAQLAILNETVVRLSPEGMRDFAAALDRPVEALPRKALERMARRAPWERPKRR